MKRWLKIAGLIVITLVLAFIIWYPVSMINRDRLIQVFGKNGQEIRRFEEFGIPVRDVNKVMWEVFEPVPKEQLKKMKGTDGYRDLVLEANKRVITKYAQAISEKGFFPLMVIDNTFNGRGLVLSWLISAGAISAVCLLAGKLKKSKKKASKN